MSRGHASDPASVLRACLGCRWMPLRVTAREIVRRALKDRTRDHAAAELGMARSSLYQLLSDYPECAP